VTGKMSGQRRMIGLDAQPRAARVHANKCGSRTAACATRHAAFDAQLARFIAGQGFHLQQRARQEHRVDAIAQLREDLRCIEPGRHHQGGEPRDPCHRVVFVLAYEEGAVDDAWNAVELMVQVTEGAALAGNIDQVAVRPCSTKRSGPRNSISSASAVACSTWPPCAQQRPSMISSLTSARAATALPVRASRRDLAVSVEP